MSKPDIDEELPQLSDAELSQLSDEELAKRWSTGARASESKDDDWSKRAGRAGSVLVKRYFDQLRGFLVNTIPDEDCVDVLGEALERLTKAMPKFKGNCSFRTYLFKILRNTCVDYFRRRKPNFDPTSDSIEDIAGIGQSSMVAALQSHRRLNACLRKLPLVDREIVELRFWHDWSYAEIGELLGMSEGAVRTRMFRLREALRTSLPGEREELSREDAEADLNAALRELGCELRVSRDSAEASAGDEPRSPTPADGA